MKSIKINYDGIDYTLEYTRKAVEEMEDAGFVLREVTKRPATNFPVLFEGAFLAHHRYAIRTQGLMEKIYKSLPDKQELMKKLIQMYGDTVDSLFDDPEPSEKNASWEANF